MQVNITFRIQQFAKQEYGKWLISLLKAMILAKRANKL